MGDQLVEVVRDGGVATVRMNRPPVNAISPDLLDQLTSAFAELGADADVRCIVLASALPGQFMAGADLAAMGAGAGGGDLEETIVELQGRFTAVERTPKPVVAAISGHALGGGCELALCCDYRVMIDDSRSTIGLTETARGLIPGGGGTQRLPRQIGVAAARRMILEGTRLRAPEAKAIGLVEETAPAEGFEEAVTTLAQRLAGMATRSLGLAKLALLDGLDLPLHEGLRHEAHAFAQVLTTADAAEGISAFLGKRPAQFTGR